MLTIPIINTTVEPVSLTNGIGRDAGGTALAYGNVSIGGSGEPEVSQVKTSTASYYFDYSEALGGDGAPQSLSLASSGCIVGYTQYDGESNAGRVNIHVKSLGDAGIVTLTVTTTSTSYDMVLNVTGT